MQISPETNIKKEIIIKRVFHHIKSEIKGSTIVFFAGIHGNEVAGVSALKNIFKTIHQNDISGEIYAVYGNIKALQKNKRYLEYDLNRLWTPNKLNTLKNKEILNKEEEEQVELFQFINQLFITTKNPIYFIDLHTTSSKSLPFITINDALINRKFSSCFPVPTVLGIEEYLEGPLLSYLNTLGYVSIGFESGQHTDPEAIKNCEAFIFLALKHAGILKNNEVEKVKKNENILENSSKNIASIFEIIYKYHIKPKELFTMKEGFESFQNIKKGTVLATTNGKFIYSEYSAKLFMPLYQKSGDDGFFIIQEIPTFFLKLSAILRKIRADNLLTVLPGISWHNKRSGILRANLKVTRFMAKSIFHLFGYRNKHIDKTYLLLYNRERVAKNKMYKNEKWY
ncbi:succinylglutamate desuccinylase/aspartoacylase family protein [Winogradskyella litoriviva]|uniref:Succinylglutamate desuccinylase/aspartoacylase family protein n=1 Tax=Winogradskyella litoriviva TaxID=1220182 RepID=A0ABX2E1T1_9FLAO|nr:succinylglutamate desuccinylase/aspartoacylase family protein [Winogradskyella litoriviva]NRD22209.1 succinylglutamate desuccinylase/aspartoacylase family protein [Winogradskyella litoriviva]